MDEYEPPLSPNINFVFKGTYTPPLSPNIEFVFGLDEDDGLTAGLLRANYMILLTM